MALITCDFFSDALGLNTSMNVILPQTTRRQIGMVGRADAGGPHPTLWLLHGLSDDHTIWSRRTAIERYVADRGIAVVMPAVHRSFYTDMASGLRYWTFISEELPAIARSFFPLSDKREDNFVAGLSMGGYGALKLALHHPERYAAAASLSGALDIVSLVQRATDDRIAEWAWTFGDDFSQIRGSENDLFHLASQLAASDRQRPRLWMSCGTADFLYQDNLRYHRHLQGLDLPHHYAEQPDASHTWDYWEQAIQDVLDWLPRLPRPAVTDAARQAQSTAG
ncbi:MAG: alpha/beta hydrolase family protein [Phycisphaeraceae bacterium]